MKNSVEFQHITKYFPGVRALDDISFTANGGEVLAFLGENGAGKSTLLKILNGDYQPSAGDYLLNGKHVHFQSPHEAIESGVSVIYQERQILVELSVAENIFLGRMPVNKFGVIDAGLANKKALEIINDFGLAGIISPIDKVKDLSIAHQQMIEIMKAYSRENLTCICFDEPTASLSDSDIDILFNIIKKLRDEGKVVIYVSHRMSEIKRIADRVAIFKDGKLVTILNASESNEQKMIKLMVGRDLGDVFANLDRNQHIGDVYFEVQGLYSDYVEPVSFKLRHGEVLGFSGLVGAGRTEIMRAIIGADKMLGGKILLDGREVCNTDPHEAILNGIVMVPEDRKFEGILSNLDVGNNITIGALDQNSNRIGVLDQKAETKMTDEGIKEFAIKTPDSKKLVVELSGGNQQKCVVARWMATKPKVLILDEPTKGIDVGAKSEFYNLICRFAKQGLGVILVSSELPEIIGLCDRIIVMKNKRISGIVERKDATEDRLLALAMADEKIN
ncbi:MAG: sugar ABC transporter ATP-binding protein [Sphaerochaetaceae bacterium]